MNRLLPFYHVTKQLEELLVTLPPNNRDETIRQVNQLMDQRGQLLEEINPPFTDEEKQLGEKAMVMNQMIQQKMLQLFSELKHEIKAMKRQEKSNRNYVHPYQSVQTNDGMFMDSKK